MANQFLTREKVLRDPIHNYIYIKHQVILDLLNSKELQRLRRIKQLGTTSYSFHGAEHSRFSHSVGVYEITRQICDLFARNYPSQAPGDGLWDDQERLVALCAALLHDVGHGAYSHTFEKILGTDHEKITIQIILDEHTEVNQALRKVAFDFPQKVAQVIAKTYPNPQVVQLISSQIDADRMDYLLRDSYFTGAKYGTFDLTRILRVMRPDAHGIVFDIEGMHAVEDYVVSRFQMYQQIYFYSVSRSMEVILGNLLQRASELYQQKKLNDPLSEHFLVPFFKKDFTLADYLALDDNVLNTCFTVWSNHSDQILSNLAQRFLKRQPFKSVRVTEQTKILIPQLIQLIQDVGYHSQYFTALNDSFDLPYDAYQPQASQKRTQIQLRQDDGSLIELSKASRLVSAISGKKVGDERFFFPKEMLQKKPPEIFAPKYAEFNTYLKNDALQLPH